MFYFTNFPFISLFSFHFISPKFHVFQEFNRITDTWKIFDELSDGCGSPIYGEENYV